MDRPREPIGRPNWELVEIDPVDVFYQPSGSLCHDILSANGIAQAVLGLEKTALKK